MNARNFQWLWSVYHLLLCLAFGFTQTQSERCLNTEEEVGICVSMNGCPYFMDEYYLKVRRTPAGISFNEFIEESTCGVQENKIMICCPIRTNTSVVLPPPQLTNGQATISMLQFSSLRRSTPNPNNIPPSPIPDDGNRKYQLPQPIQDRCGISNTSQTRVVGGLEARRGAYPWLGALGYRNTMTKEIEFECSASLITSRHMLTAAHCINSKLVLVRLGVHHLEEDVQDAVDVTIQSVKIHEEYNTKDHKSDIALLKLARDVPIDGKIRPICLPILEPIKSMDFTGLNPFIAGWGAIQFQGPTSKVLRDTQVPVIDLKQCEADYKVRYPSLTFDERIICAGDSRRDACQGDSGGPLMYPQFSPDRSFNYFTLIGIISYGYECAKPNYPGVYTRVSHYITWIEKYLND